MRDGDNIRNVAAFNPDYLGFIFFPQSPRYVGEDFRIPEEMPASIQRVGVFVNESTEEIVKKSGKFGLTHIQLHGNEPLEQAMALKDSGLSVIKVFSIDDAFKFQLTKPFVPVVDFFLFDTKGTYHGGNATKFNWDVLKHYDQEVPFFLSGGLSAENVREIVSLEGMNLFALDVNSGVEERPGYKSLKKLQEFVDSIGETKIIRTM